MAITKNAAINHDPAFVGQIADLQVSNLVSKLNATNATLPCGTAVQADGDEGAKPVESGGKPIGVVTRELVNDGELGIKPGRTGDVMTLGVIWVVAGEAVSKGDAVYAGVGTNVKGKFTKTAGSGVTEAVVVADAEWLDTTAKDGLGRISIRIGG